VSHHETLVLLCALGAAAFVAVLLLRVARATGFSARGLFLLSATVVGFLATLEPELFPSLRGLVQPDTVTLLVAAMALFAAGIAAPRLDSWPRCLGLAVLLAGIPAALGFAAARALGASHDLALLFGAGAGILGGGCVLESSTARSTTTPTGHPGVHAALLAAPLAAALASLAASEHAAAADFDGWRELGKGLLSLAGATVLGGAAGYFIAKSLPSLSASNPMWRALLFFGAASLLLALALMLRAAPLMALVVAGVVAGQRLSATESALRATARRMARSGELLAAVLIGLMLGGWMSVRIPAALLPGLGLALVLIFAARPAAFLLAGAAKKPWIATVFAAPHGALLAMLAGLGSIGRLGAVPLGNGPGALLDVLLVALAVDLLVQDIVDLVRRRGSSPPPAEVDVSISSDAQLAGILVEAVVREGSALAGRRLLEISMPEGASVILIVRGTEVLPARGWSQLEPGDVLHLLGDDASVSSVQRMASAE
jgi:cell volume regulation protein A